MGEIGPQYSRDSAFTARTRFHQSWYRARALGVPCGTGPTARSRSRYGNMLRGEDGERGLNFLTPRIFSVVRRRLAENRGAMEPFRLLCNMLSSQPMCFNLFGPLVEDADLATTLLKSILPDGVARVTRVAVEDAPQPAEEYLDDRTAFDAFIEYERGDGGLAFLGVETKLSEPFLPGTYDKPAYRRWVEQPDSPWLTETWDRVADSRHNQLWRGHLLAVALLHHPRSRHAAGRFALVRHAGDHECADTVAGYRRLLKPGDDSFLDLPLDHVVSAWERAAPREECRRWLADFRLRYLDLAASEEEWRCHRRTS